MRVVCLGSGGYYSTDRNLTMSFIVPELGIVFDCGSGLYRAKEFINDGDVIHIFITHSHIDHIVGMTSLKKLNAKVFVHATQQVLSDLEIMLNPPFVGTHPEYVGVPLIEGQDVCLDSGAKVYHFDVNHTCPCKGYKLEYSGKTMCFITDTSSNCDSCYIKHVIGADLLFHECYGLESCSSGHTSALKLVEFLNVAKPKHTVIVHHNPIGNQDEILNELRKSVSHIDDAVDRKSYEI